MAITAVRADISFTIIFIPWPLVSIQFRSGCIVPAVEVKKGGYSAFFVAG